MSRLASMPALLAALSIAALAGCTAGAPDEAAASAPLGHVSAWLTQSGGPDKLSRRPDLPLAAGTPEPLHIAVDSAARLQEIIGFGAALTDASAWLLQHRMNAQQRGALLQELFGRGDGIGIGFLRLTIGASDFSLSHYSLDDVPAGAEDLSLAQFSIAPNRDAVLPLTQRALAINPQLAVMASPWSAPAWMKTSGSLVSGRLREDRHAVFAEYLSRYVQAWEAAGVPIFAITLQNEPHFEPADYPGMLLDVDARRRLIGEHVGPLFAGRHPGTRILEWDHNWNEPEAPLGLLADAQARPFVAGVAWHCYAGEVSAQSIVHASHPDKETYLTECSGGGWEPREADALTDMVRELLIGGTRNWSRGVLLWNLALDEQSGPHMGGCGNCRGVVTVDSATGEVTRNPEYYALGHFGRFIRPGARRIGSTQGGGGLDNVAFRNEDDGSFVLVVANSASAPRRFSAGEPGCLFVDTLPARSVATYAWTPPVACRRESAGARQ